MPLMGIDIRVCQQVLSDGLPESSDSESRGNPSAHRGSGREADPESTHKPLSQDEQNTGGARVEPSVSTT